MMNEYTIYMFPTGEQITMKGFVEPTNMVGFTFTKEITEVVDDNVVHYYSFESTTSREKAAKILSDLELYGDFYYQLEDWLTDFLDGKERDMPIGVECEYLRCALRLEVRDFFDSRDDIEDIDSEDIEECVNRILNHFSHNVLDMDFIFDIVNEYLDECKEELMGISEVGIDFTDIIDDYGTIVGKGTIFYTDECVTRFNYSWEVSTSDEVFIFFDTETDPHFKEEQLNFVKGLLLDNLKTNKDLVFEHAKPLLDYIEEE